MSEHKLSADLAQDSRWFLSQRWRFLLPLALFVLAAAVIGAYVTTRHSTSGAALIEQNILLQSSQAAARRTQELHQDMVMEARRIALTDGIAAELAAAGQPDEAWLEQLRSMAATARLDSVILTDAQGREWAGLLALDSDDSGAAFSVSSGTDLSGERLVQGALDAQRSDAAGLLRTPQGLLLYTAVPASRDGVPVGAVLVGQRLSRVLDALRASTLADIALYDVEGDLLATTLELNEGVLQGARLDPGVLRQTLGLEQVDGPGVMSASVPLGETVYRSVYRPFAFGPDVMGVTAVLVPANVPLATETNRQMLALLASLLAAAVVLVGFAAISLLLGRLDRVRQTVQALARGETGARTGMRARDEVGALGQAVDSYASEVQAREDQFRAALRRQRREFTYLLSILEAIPDGVVVQDRTGQVVLVNERARALLGAGQAFDAGDVQRLNLVVSDVLGRSIAPGVYALGDPQAVQRSGRMLSAQSAAVVSSVGQRLGTVILLRDITRQVRDYRMREELLQRLSADVQQPLAELARTAAGDGRSMVTEFGREISRHAAALQKAIVDMRELTRYNRHDAIQRMRPLHTETLIWALVNDWRQIAQVAGIELRVMIDRQGLYVLGDESRLRFAIGNVIDNAIKYTPAGGMVTLEIRDAVDGAVHMRVRDNGAGIADADMPHLFTPFYRGTPIGRDGEAVRVPGMGQGLPVARQIIEAHGGVIRVKSRVGVGTAVYVALPLTSSVSYELPLVDAEVLEGETVRIAEDIDIEAFWRRGR